MPKIRRVNPVRSSPPHRPYARASAGETSNGANRDLEFLYEVGSLRNIQRGWRQYFGIDMANNLEHTLRVIWLALMIARGEGKGDENIIIKMALVHDIADTRTADHAYVQKVYVDEKDTLAAHDIFAETSIKDYETILHAYKERASIEARIVKDADNLDVDLELKEVEERGHTVPTKKAGHRRLIRDEKLYTETAKKIWDEIQESNPSSWHLSSNKWLKIPSAGK